MSTRSNYEEEFSNEAKWSNKTIAELEDDYFNDLIITAVEGGTGYWAVVQNYDWQTREDVDKTKPVTVEFMEEDEYPNGEWHKLSGDDPKWRTAVRKAAKDRGKSLHAFMIDHDAEYADIAVQFWMFGKLVYG